MLAAKEKTASGGAPPLQAETRVWGVTPESGICIGACSQVNSTLRWGSWHSYAGTASDGLVNRYYSNAYGRFMTPDPYKASGSPSDPQTWNRFAYAGGDPTNRADPRGLDFIDCPLDGCLSPEGPGYCDPSMGPGFCNGGGGNACVAPDGFTQMPNPGCSVTEGDYGPPTVQPQPSQPSKSQQCPSYIYNFLTTMIPYANQLASTWSTNANDILALSAYESGWLNIHNTALQNPYGLTNAGGNNIQFSSFQQATNFWSNNDGSYIQNITNINSFATALQPHYNTVNPIWSATVVSVYNSVLKWEAICGLQP